MVINTANSSVSIFDSYPTDSPVSSAAVVRLLYVCASSSDGAASLFERKYLPTIRQALHKRSRLCEYRQLTCSANYNETNLLIVFDKRDLTLSDKEEIKKRIVNDDNCLLAVFCTDGSPPGDGFWEYVLGSPKTRFCQQAENEDRLQTATDEIVQYFTSELDSSAADGEHYSHQLSQSVANGSAFCPFGSGAVSRALLTHAASLHDDAWVARDQLNEALRHHLHSPGPLAPLLIRGSQGAGVTGALAKWLLRTKEAFAPNILVLYHQALDSQSLTADACLMLRQFCEQMRTHVPTQTTTEDSTAMNANDLK
uniref:Uncharacterized protein n=1 Tax=Plectus sambesii TaxID=2011161 RepID=A0A914UJD7_9BILA